MDILSNWATNLAIAADPSEVDLAPDIVSAYVAGGEIRAELFQQAEASIAGGFGPGTVIALLPWVLQGIAATANTILGILASSEIGNILGMLKDLLDIKKDLNSEKRLEQLPSTSPYAALKQVIDTMDSELRKAGLPAQEADLITFRVVNVLLGDLEGTATFLKHLE